MEKVTGFDQNKPPTPVVISRSRRGLFFCSGSNTSVGRRFGIDFYNLLALSVPITTTLVVTETM